MYGMNLFVYGTLRSGHDNPMAQYLRQHAHLIGHGYVPGRLFDLGWYPGATYEPDCNSCVWGDVYKITDESVLSRLDEYEGIESLPDDEYARREVSVQMNLTPEEVSEVHCQMYVFIKADGQQTLIESGNFLRR